MTTAQYFLVYLTLIACHNAVAREISDCDLWMGYTDTSRGRSVFVGRAFEQDEPLDAGAGTPYSDQIPNAPTH